MKVHGRTIGMIGIGGHSLQCRVLILFVFKWFLYLFIKIMGHRASVGDSKVQIVGEREGIISYMSVPLIHPTLMPINSVQPGDFVCLL